MGNKKYNFNDVVNEFSKTNYILLSDESEYKDCLSKMRYLCPHHMDKGEQSISLSHLREGKGCYYCGLEKFASKKRVDLREYESEAKQLCIKNDFEYVDIYRKNGVIYISFICNKHRDFGVQSMRKSNMKRNIKGCKYCSNKHLSSEYISKIVHEKNPDIEFIEPITNMTTKKKCRCKKHNIIYYTTPQNVLYGRCCVECGKEKLKYNHLKSTDEVQKRIWEKNPHIILVEEYDGDMKNKKCFCSKHMKYFSKHLSTLYYCDSGCDECYKELMRERFGTGQDGFKNALKQIHPELDVIGEYINNNTPIEIYCRKHDYYYKATPVSILDKFSCCPKSRSTYKEESVCQLLENWGYKITRQKEFEDCIDKRKLRFDIYLDDYNVLIEYQGEQHYYPISYDDSQSLEDIKNKYEYTISHDEIKRNYCIKNNIPLIEIPYWEYDDLEYYLFDKLTKLNVIKETTKSA